MNSQIVEYSQAENKTGSQSQQSALGQQTLIQRRENFAAHRGRSPGVTIRSARSGKPIPCGVCAEVRVLQGRCIGCKTIRELARSKPPQPEHPLKIEPLPDTLQWWDEPRYWLIHQESGLRVPGSWSLAEAESIQDLSKSWNWSVDNRRVDCGFQLIALAEATCKRTALRGGES